MSSKHNSTGFPIQVLTGGLAAITAALLGSTLGVAGTVLGAGIASVVTTIAAAIYTRSIQHTRERVRLVQAKVTGRIPAAGSDDDQETREEATPRRLNRPVVVAATLLAFALGMLAITGFEWISGHRVDGGQGTTIGGIVGPKPGPATVERPNPARSTTQPGTPSVTSTPPVPSSTGQPTSTTPPTSVSTTEQPVTTTTTTGPTMTSAPPP